MKRILQITLPAIIAVSLALGQKPMTPEIGRREGSVTQREQGRPARITAAEAKHIVAYYFKAQNKLVVYNQKSLAAGIQKGVYQLAWRPGAKQAALSVQVTQRAASGKEMTVSVRVTTNVVYNETPGGPVNPEPQGLVNALIKLGDTKLVEYQKLHTNSEIIGQCANPPQPEAPKNSRVGRYVQPEFTYLEGNGEVSGTQTYMVIGRYYWYAIAACTKGYLGSTDWARNWVLSIGPWPNP